MIFRDECVPVVVLFQERYLDLSGMAVGDPGVTARRFQRSSGQREGNLSFTHDSGSISGNQRNRADPEKLIRIRVHGWDHDYLQDIVVDHVNR